MARGLSVAAAMGLGLAAALVAPSAAHAVIGGEEATQLTGVVSLTNEPASGGVPQHVCSGVLIGPRWIVTANHCLKTYTMGAAKVGGLDRTVAKTVPVAAQYQAPVGDLGLVKLAASAPGPYASWSTERPRVGAVVEVAGFGATSADGREQSTIVRVARGRVEAVRTDPDYGGEMITWSFERGRTGVGDSGGPLLADGVVVGAHSGIFDGDAGAAGFETSAKWIRRMTGIAEMSGTRESALRWDAGTFGQSQPVPQASEAPSAAPSPHGVSFAEAMPWNGGIGHVGWWWPFTRLTQFLSM